MAIDLTTIGVIVGIIAGLVAIAGAFFTQFLPWWRIKRNQHFLKKRFGAEHYPEGVIENSIRYYIEPDCQSLDPAGAEEPRLIYGAKQNLFNAVDDVLSHPTEYRYLILLADSGMGKTSFLLNYYARHMRRRRRKFNLALVPLGIPDAAQYINNISDKKKTILFLDAFDEDTLGIKDHSARLHDLIKLTSDFPRVLITCRTQFFPKDEEIPKEVPGIMKVGPRRAGESAYYVFHKLYLSPFSDEQVEAYLRRRYSFRQHVQRKMAYEMVKKIPQLSVRPMLLTHIDDLVKAKKEVKYTFELYEEMVEAWLEREEGIFEGLKKEPLRKFSELLAFDLYCNRQKRGAERMPKEELAILAKRWNIPLEDWQLTTRSLLNRDALGNYKFAHRSIMEYLFVERLLKVSIKERPKIEWTDLMKSFLIEKIKYKAVGKNLQRVDLSGSDLSGLDLTGFDFTKANLRDSNFVGTNFQGANLEGQTFEIGTIYKTNMKGAKLTGTIMANKTLNMKFIYIFPRSFQMGSSNDEHGRYDNETLHEVILTKGFHIQITPVTQGQWKAVMGNSNNPSRFKDCGDNCPVEQVSWEDVKEFIKKLNQMENTNVYRLPTEAEWEYACRAGSKTRYYFGDDGARLSEYAWYWENSNKRTHPVAKKKPNAWGLYDMHGNVWEWCEDWYGDYKLGSVIDPKGPSNGSGRVVRGGGWSDLARLCRSADRLRFAPDDRFDLLGFRLVRSLP